MGSLIYILFISIFFPLGLMMLVVEKKARLPIIFVMVGIFVSVFASEVNGVLLKTLNMTRYDATITLAPVTEELLKAFPILFYAVVVSDKKEQLFTALPYRMLLRWQLMKSMQPVVSMDSRLNTILQMMNMMQKKQSTHTTH